MKYLLPTLAFFLLISCSNEEKSMVELKGNAQGTTFTIKYLEENNKDYSAEISKILEDIDTSLSLWKPASEINKFNKDTTKLIEIKNENDYFRAVFKQSKDVYKRTGGYFDPSINELIELWGFGLKKVEEVNEKDIDEVLHKSSFDDGHLFIDSTWFSTSRSIKFNKNKTTQLNFNAIAQGYAVDVISNFLISKNVSNHFIELGGEIRVHGLNHERKLWSIGIDRPISDQRIIDYKLTLDNASIATSGSYRKFIERDGKRYSHTIDPISGYPVQHNDLSVTVQMKECSFADAYATAFMVMGKEKTLQFLEKNKDLGIEVVITSEVNGQLETYISDGLSIEALNE